MLRIVIIEGDDPAQLAESRHQGFPSNADIYQASLRACAKDLVFQLMEPYAKDYDPTSLDLANVDGVVFTGSTVNWSVDSPEAWPIRQTMERVFQAKVPVLGSCNGMQLAAVVLGGEVGPSPNGRELGMAKNIQLTDAGKKHPLHKSRTTGFSCCCIHRDEVTRLPEGAVLTASNKHSKVQAFTYEQAGICFWGMQYHPEMNPGQIAQLIAGNGLFTGDEQLADDLQALEQTKDSARLKRLNIRASDLEPDMMMQELYNWLEMIRQRKSETL